VNEIGSIQRENLSGNFPPSARFSQRGEESIAMRNSKWKLIRKMMRLTPKNFATTLPNAAGWRGTASETDRVVLIEIAEAWMVCAEQAERDARRNRKH